MKTQFGKKVLVEAIIQIITDKMDETTKVHPNCASSDEGRKA